MNRRPVGWPETIALIILCSIAAIVVSAAALAVIKIWQQIL